MMKLIEIREITKIRKITEIREWNGTVQYELAENAEAMKDAEAVKPTRPPPRIDRPGSRCFGHTPVIRFRVIAAATPPSPAPAQQPFKRGFAYFPWRVAAALSLSFAPPPKLGFSSLPPPCALQSAANVT